MHYTLTPRGNAVLMVLMSAALLACFFSDSSPSKVVLTAFAIAGLLAGLLQASAIRRHSFKFQTADTARQVRAALISSTPGKISIALLWLTAFVLIAFLVHGGEYANIQTAVGSYAAFCLAREIAALPALFVLRHRKI
jgi:hypothetical protein